MILIWWQLTLFERHWFTIVWLLYLRMCINCITNDTILQYIHVYYNYIHVLHVGVQIPKGLGRIAGLYHWYSQKSWSEIVCDCVVVTVSVCLSVYLSVCLSAYLSVSVFVYLICVYARHVFSINGCVLNLCTVYSTLYSGYALECVCVAVLCFNWMCLSVWIVYVIVNAHIGHLMWIQYKCKMLVVIMCVFVPVWSCFWEQDGNMFASAYKYVSSVSTWSSPP